MTSRRTLERNVIDAAQAFVRHQGNYGNLVEAVTRLDEAPLAKPKVAPTSVLHPDTSWQAARSMREQLTSDCQDILDALAAVGGLGDDPIGLTVDQLEQRLARSHQSVSARVNQLMELGWIRDSDVRRPTRSGRRAIVWVLTPQAKETMRRG
jgi:DNA-binding MarR family transcriptional regulator